MIPSTLDGADYSDARRVLCRAVSISVLGNRESIRFSPLLGQRIAYITFYLGKDIDLIQNSSLLGINSALVVRCVLIFPANFTEDAVAGIEIAEVSWEQRASGRRRT